jgi:APA family basic amino acid/polyamine antiporter
MARRGDAPPVFARIGRSGSPTAAVLAVGAAICVPALLGDVRLSWSFSAFTVLIYYAITNLAALRLPKERQLYSRLFAWSGLFGCLFLAFWVDRTVWLVGLGLLAAGLFWHVVATRYLFASAAPER